MILQEYKLDDLLDILTDYHANGSYKILKENVMLLDEPDYALMIRTTNFEQNNFETDCKYINKHSYDFLEKSKVFPGDIVMNKIANAGSIYYVPNLEGYISLAMNLFLLRFNKSIVNQHYMYYYLKNIEENIKQLANGAAAKTITKKSVKEIKVKIPEINIQNRIVDVISKYDDLIENNLKRIKLLEKTAELIYKEWFINFRFPGYDKHEFLNGIPKGWEKSHLSEIVSTQYGFTESALDEDTGVKYLRGTDINKTSYVNWADVPWCNIDDADKLKYKLKKYDIVVIRMADPGKVGIVERDIEAVFASYLIRLSIVSDRIKPYYLFYFLNSDFYQKFISQSSTGATRKSANAKLITDVDIMIPSKELVEQFENKIGDLRKLLNNLLEQNQKLKEARDILIQKLIMGEIEV